MKTCGFFWRLKLTCQSHLSPNSLVPTADGIKGVTAEFMTDSFILDLEC